ncbi:selenocysteine-specific translation elongation factor [Moellerella wisconsensis]|uniref:selenocysteine-specific translation elongation factor n=1 Tax=Moellerella wisconsensis TaxID=158849 RepID=UPI001F4DAF6E|nr:selenocysteine-specific translation elongation factor [Moellerella wisconsensis]UNH42417.1 selenocysteine-specific translation elongation factor [Moellerella wisconsensis]
MIFATAGHVDHGKTSLIQAITGVNTAHLPEEKKRGMTIDLGYAYWPQADGSSIGFIDVPGHEKFLANMLAGIGGISHALLVVACDDGVMAQTLEHLSILRLAGCPNITVILTKADKASAEQIEMVRQQCLALLWQHGWDNCPLFVTSIADKQSISELRSHLQLLHHQHDNSLNTDKRFRLAIDRVFSVKGAGLVVTGTALAGNVQVGDNLWLTGVDKLVRVRGLHAQNQVVESAQAGDRIALNIAGDIDKDQVSRGEWLLAEQPPFMASRVLVELQADVGLKNWQPLHLYHGASHITGRIALLNHSDDIPFLAELVLDTPLWLANNDRLILRDISARHTLGSGRVIQLQSPRRGKRRPEFLSWLTQLATETDPLSLLKLQFPGGELNIQEYGWACQLTETALTTLLSQVDIVQTGDIVLSRTNAQFAKQRLISVLSDYHQTHMDQIGVGRARLKRMALPTFNDQLIFMLINELLDEGELIQTRGWLHMPEHGIEFDAEQQRLWQQIIPLFSSPEPWWVRDLASKLNIDEAIIRNVLKRAAQLGLVTAIVRDRYYSSEHIAQFTRIIMKYTKDSGAINAANFRDELGVGRKLAIQILEFFDKTGFTRRKGDQHFLRDKGLFIE